MTDAGPALEARGVTCGYDGRAVLDCVNVELGRGEFLSLIGPNGSGKTTLLRALAGVMRVDSGEVLLEGRPIGSYARHEIARRLAVVPQMSAAAFDFSVREIVRMGRTPHLGRLESERPADREAVAEALALTDTEQLADRLVTELSGGELQRVTIARALAQQSPIMLLYEPAAFLDISHQLRTFDLPGGRVLRARRAAGRGPGCGRRAAWRSHHRRLDRARVRLRGRGGREFERSAACVAAPA